MASNENIEDLRWTLESVIRTVAESGDEVLIVDRDGRTELAVIIGIDDYRRLNSMTAPDDSR